MATAEQKDGVSHRGRALTKLVGEFVATKKNTVCAGFYPDHGFALAAERDGESILYELDLRSTSPAAPGWIEVREERSKESFEEFTGVRLRAVG